MYFKKIFIWFKNFDWILLISVLLLLSFGLAALYGIAKGFNPPDFLNLKKQIIFALIGTVLLLALNFFDYNLLKQFANYFYMGAAILLVAVLFLGKTFKGTTGWFSFMGLNFQPVEIAKIALIIFLARYLSEKNYLEKNFRFIVTSGLAVALYFFLIVSQPDLGSALIIFILWFGLLIFSKLQRSQLFFIIGLVFVLFILGWSFFFKDYQKDRIMSFLNPSLDPYSRGYHVRQAVIAVGSGKFFGRGLASGSQSQLQFIPASQTDFTYAVIAEELGFIGAILVLGFYTILFLRIIFIARQTHDEFALYVIMGISILLFSHFFINIGMNIGLLPVTGIGLPFISYGGSFLVSCFLMIGIIESIARRRMKYKV